MKNTSSFIRRLTALFLSVLLIVLMIPLAQIQVYAVNDMPYYNISVYWTVEDSNNDEDNYFELEYKYPKVTGYADGSSGKLKYKAAAASEGKRSTTFKNVQGVPIKLFYQCYGRTANQSRWYVNKITIQPVNPVEGTGLDKTITFWEGELGIEIAAFAGNSNSATITFDQKPYISAWSKSGVGDNFKNSTKSYYFHMSSTNKPVYAYSATPPSCVDEVYANTESDINTYYVTDGVVYDQYGARFPNQSKTHNVRNYPQGIYFGPFTQDTSELLVWDEGNRSKDYTINMGYSFEAEGIISSKIITVHTFDYYVTFKDEDGTVMKKETVDYYQSATPPEIPEFFEKDNTICQFTG